MEISVSFTENCSITWRAPAPTQVQDKARLRMLLSQKLEEIGDTERRKPLLMQKRAAILTLLVAFNDPTSTLDELDELCAQPGPDHQVQRKLEHLVNSAHFWLMDTFDDGYCPRLANSTRPPSTTAAGRSAGDRRAQREVPEWYRDRCLLSGTAGPHGAHIVPVRSTTPGRAQSMWTLLRRFWSGTMVGQVDYETKELTNVVPMGPGAHSYWDSYRFALRPIRHPTEPQRHLYIQMVKLHDVFEEGNLVRGPTDQDHVRTSAIHDCRRGDKLSSPIIQHGDVFLLTTPDPVSRPLPSVDMLEIQYSAHKILGGLKAGGALRTIFEGDPPDDPGEGYDEIEINPIWQFLIQEAEDQAILSAREAQIWTRSCAALDGFWRSLAASQSPDSTTPE